MSYSFAGLIFVRISANTITNAIIMTSTTISNCFAVENSLIIPISHIALSTHGSRYLITNFHVLPTENIEYSLRAGIILSTL